MNDIEIYNRRTEDVVRYTFNNDLTFAVGEELHYTDSKGNKVYAYIRKVIKELIVSDNNIDAVKLKIEVF